MPDQTLSRRTLVRSAGWTVPAVAVAVAAPMAAASGGTASRITVLSEQRQSIEEGVTLVVVVNDSAGQPVSGLVTAELPDTGAAVFLFPDEGTRGLRASVRADDGGLAVFPVDASAPVSLTVQLASGGFSTSTSLEIVE
ncbi:MULTISPECIES: hypothetical protein [unclassified Rathayibacter]|uniref:hypothetical protein n=1 Tax=unclassified Rathayibacter TaxID=2609250 RepID=UPI00188B61DD|nr:MULTISPECIES: hypothetical protein [unclassified Rathayibacter]MBF4462836.1 hypothetical protein [Rathayibacter sp. VKM Ac-2879]MBF4504250.1 hypothetical protein [Rathayibacter sp. VKM Ac-2878]